VVVVVVVVAPGNAQQAGTDDGALHFDNP